MVPRGSALQKNWYFWEQVNPHAHVSSEAVRAGYADPDQPREASLMLTSREAQRNQSVRTTAWLQAVEEPGKRRQTGTRRALLSVPQTLQGPPSAPSSSILTDPAGPLWGQLLTHHRSSQNKSLVTPVRSKEAPTENLPSTHQRQIPPCRGRQHGFSLRNIISSSPCSLCSAQSTQ